MFNVDIPVEVQGYVVSNYFITKTAWLCITGHKPNRKEKVGLSYKGKVTVEDVEYDNIRFLGEIYICYDRCVEQASEYGHSIKREFCYLAVHGLLHLLGYDHMTEEDKKVMRAKEEEILGEYDITR